MATININDFSGGLNQHTSPDLIGANQAPMLLNCVLDQDGNVAHRTGSDLLKKVTGTGKVYGMGVHHRAAGTDRLYWSAGGALYYYNGTNWDTTVSSEGITDAYDVSFTSFGDNLYYVSAKDGETVMKIADADSPTAAELDSTNDPDGKYLASGNGSLLLAGWYKLPNRIFFSEVGTDQFKMKKLTVESAANTGVNGMTLKITTNDFTTDMNGWAIYNITAGTEAQIEQVLDANEADITGISAITGWEDDVIVVMDNFLDLDDAVTGLVSLGEQSPFLGFTKTDAYVFDPKTGYSKKMAGFGCSSHKNIAVVNGTAIWAGRTGVFAYSPSAYVPEELSVLIRNDLFQNGIWDKVTEAGLNSSAAFVDDDKYFLAIGNLSEEVRGLAQNDIVLCFDFAKKAWTAHSYTTNGLGYCFAVYTDATAGKMIVSGSRDDMSIYKMNVADLYTDDDSAGTATAVTATYIHKPIESGELQNNKTLLDAYMKLYASVALTITYATDGATSFTAWTSTGTTGAGYDWHYQRLAPFGHANLKAISMKIAGTGKWVLYYIGYDLKESQSTTLTPV